jgi:hypothetical protein
VEVLAVHIEPVLGDRSVARSIPPLCSSMARLRTIHAMASWKFYAVKTLYRISARGRPARADRYYEETATLVEERVVAFRARSFDEAIRLAEEEAREYARKVNHKNPYGQTVRAKYLRACDAYLLNDWSSGRGEVYSRTELVSSEVSDATIVTRLLGRSETGNRVERRRKFVPG